jgi:four helix bundle protein
LVVREFRELKVWSKGHRLTLGVYEATVRFPAHEGYRLRSQLRRCSASIPANIAEGCGKRGDTELGRYLLISMGSASELEYHLLLAYDLGYLDPDQHRNLTDQTQEVKKMLSTFIKTLRRPPT